MRLLAFVLFLCVSQAAHAQSTATITGQVSDPAGGRLPSAAVHLLRNGQQVDQTASDADGTFTFGNVPDGRYVIRTEAPGFQPKTTEPMFVSGRTTINVVMSIGPLQESVVISAAATELPQGRTGAPITVIDQSTLAALNKPDVLEALRLVPGAQIVQTGQRGATASMFVRGGNSNFNKVLVDGIAANDIGGAFDFAQMATAGVERIEILRQSNSVMYGSDALAGVVNITTRRGRTHVPQVEVSADGGTFDTRRGTAALGGVVGRFDYFSEYAYFTTDNSTPNNDYRNGTYAGRFGAAVGRATDISGTVRRTDTRFGSPNAFKLFGIADDSRQSNAINYAGVNVESQHTDRWQSTLRFGHTDFRSTFTNPSPSGEAFDAFGFGANYLGRVATLTGANGYSVTGQGVLDFGGTYPSVFRSRTRRRALFADTTYHVRGDFDISGGGRVEREDGFGDPDADPTGRRNNGGAFAEARGSVGMHTYVTGGVGLEHNEAFDNAVTPRLSVATYVREPSALSALGDMKISFNAGKGIKAPSVFQEQSALSTLGPERSTSIDIGVEQGLWYGRARVRAAYFHNTYENLIEFLNRTQLSQAGVPPAVAATKQFGAYLNSSSFRAQGIETSFDSSIGQYLRVNASYTYLDAVVTEAFSAVTAINPAFPGIAIGAFSPLVGERPFRRPANSGSLMISVTRGAAQVTFAGYFAGKRDDSTFLSDRFFGNSLLLPNRDLAAPYQKLDLSASYRLHPHLSVYTSIENIVNQDYDASFGYPSLPRAARAGVRVTLGGE
jgi:vitamin B12 transporter